MDQLRLRVEGEVGGAPLRCWHLADPQLCPTVESLAHTLAQKLGLPPVRVYMDGFLVPPFEPTIIMRDGDLIRLEAASATHVFPALNNTDADREPEPTSCKKTNTDRTAKRESENSSANERPTKKRKRDKESTVDEKDKGVKKTKEGEKKGKTDEGKEKEKGKDKKTKGGEEKGLKEGKKTAKEVEKKQTKRKEDAKKKSGGGEKVIKEGQKRAVLTKSKGKPRREEKETSEESSSSESEEEEQTKSKVKIGGNGKASVKEGQPVPENGKNKNSTTRKPENRKAESESSSSSERESSSDSESDTESEKPGKSTDKSAKELTGAAHGAKNTETDKKKRKRKKKKKKKKKGGAGGAGEENTTNEKPQSVQKAQRVEEDQPRPKQTQPPREQQSDVREAVTRERVAERGQGKHQRFENEARGPSKETGGERHGLGWDLNKNATDGEKRDGAAGERGPKQVERGGVRAESKNGNGPGVPVYGAGRRRQDYGSLPLFQGTPRVGDAIAFKIMEMSTAYTPEVSDYKEGKVLSYDSATGTARVWLTPHSRARTRPPDGTVSRRFEIVEGEEEEESEYVEEMEEEVEVDWRFLVEVRHVVDAS